MHFAFLAPQAADSIAPARACIRGPEAIVLR